MPALDAWRYSAAGTSQIKAQLPPSNTSYCDSIGCGVRQYVGHVHLVVLPLAWSTRTQSISLAAMGTRSLRRQLHRKAWRCRSDCQLFLDLSLLRSPDTVALYATPARRLRFDAWPQNRSYLQYGFFGADHHVFGSYGSLWAVSGLSGNSYVARSAETCSAGSLCDTCLRLILLLAEVEVWWSSSGASAGGNLRGRAEQEAELAQMLRQLIWHGSASRWQSWGDWRSCLLRTLADLTTAWLASHFSKELQEPSDLRLTAREQSCVAAGLQAAGTAGAEEAPGQAAAALEGRCTPSALLAWSRFFRAGWKGASVPSCSKLTMAAVWANWAGSPPAHGSWKDESLRLGPLGLRRCRQLHQKPQRGRPSMDS